MKNLLPFILLLFCIGIWNISNAQIEEERDVFVDRVSLIDGDSWLSTYHASDGTSVYYYIEQNNDQSTKILKAYTFDHEEIINLDISDHKLPKIYFLTDKLFDDDDDFEFVIASGDVDEASVYIMNSNGSILKTLVDKDTLQYNYVSYQNFEDCVELIKSNDGYKLIVKGYGRYNSNTDGGRFKIFSLPGGFEYLDNPDSTDNDSSDEDIETSMIEEKETSFETYVYPNPSSGTSITVAYEISNTGKLILFNTKGNVIDELLLEPSKNEVHINTSDYASGNYFYKIIEQDRIHNGKFLIS